MAGFKNYIAFSNLNDPETRGTVVLTQDGQVVSELEGAEGDYFGEYLLLSEDAPGGSLVLGATKRMPEDELDHLMLYKLLPNEDGTSGLFKVSDQVVSTTVTPARGSPEEIATNR